ncbi:MAG: hypothetical protein ACYTFI_15045 [Planctomycetota bacterium]|jgi:hypothetical protein
MAVMLVAAILVGTVVGGAAYLLNKVVAKRLRSSAYGTAIGATCIAGGAAVFFLLLGPTMGLLWAASAVHGSSVSASEFRGSGPRLPQSARAITYYSDPRGTDAVFTITGPDFVSWTSKEGWQNRSIDGEESVDLLLLKIERAITDGLVVEQQFHPRGTGVMIVYDRIKGMCYYHYSAY